MKHSYAGNSQKGYFEKSYDVFNWFFSKNINI